MNSFIKVKVNEVEETTKTMTMYNEWLKQGQGEEEDSENAFTESEGEDLDPQCKNCEKKQS
jgi:hypothetical protein